MKVSWKKYIDKTRKNKPRKLLMEAVKYLSNKKSALDLGAGALVDSEYLLSLGFEKVIAVDADDAAAERAKLIKDKSFSFEQVNFEDYSLTNNSFDLVSGQFAFSFISPDLFKRVFGDIKNSLRSDGILTGQIFGDRDEWNVENSKKSFASKEELKNILDGFDLLKVEEEEVDKETALGVMKHWHTFHFIARKH